MKKSLLCLILCLFALSISVAQTTMAQAYEDIDKAFINRSTDDLSKVLSSLTPVDSPLAESYILKKCRQLVITNEYDFSKEAVYVVIDHDMDNTSAVELYSRIEGASKKHEEELRQEQERKEALARAHQQTLEKARVGVEKNYETVKAASGEKVYLDSRSYSYSNNDWYLNIAILNLGIGSYDSNTALKYGMGAEAGYFYSNLQMSLGADLGGTINLLKLSGDNESIVSEFYLIPQLALNNLNKRLFFRVGLMGSVMNDKDDENEPDTVFVESFISPLFGIGTRNVMLGPLNFQAYYDYLLGHLADSDIKTSMQAGAFFSFVAAEMETVRLNCKFGIKDTLYVLSDGIDNRFQFSFAIGVGNVKQ